jgi:hypothetical protein
MTRPVSPLAVPPRTVMLIVRVAGPAGAGAADELPASLGTGTAVDAPPVPGSRPQPPSTPPATASAAAPTIARLTKPITLLTRCAASPTRKALSLPIASV